MIKAETKLFCIGATACLSVLLSGFSQAAFALKGYTWSQNRPVELPVNGRIQAQTSLAADAQQRVWLTFLDADYHQTAYRMWIAWPRRIRLFSSTDGGLSFSTKPDVDAVGGSATLVTGSNGETYCCYVHYFDGARRIPGMEHTVVVQNLSLPNTVQEGSRPWTESINPVDACVGAGPGTTLNVLSAEMREPPHGGSDMLLFARTTDGGKSWPIKQSLESRSSSVSPAETPAGLLLIGPAGFWRSADMGLSFLPFEAHRFGDKLARVGTNRSRDRVYVVGDSTKDGLYLESSSDGGRTWRRSRIDDAKKSQAWRYPALHVDSQDRLHVVWMDDRSGSGALYHAYSDDGGRNFSKNCQISDAPFPFPADAPYPPPANQNGTWIGNYLSITSVGDRLVVAWSDQRSGHGKSTVYVAVGETSDSKRNRKKRE